MILVLQLSLVADDLTELAGTIAGPPDTPYEGGTYRLEIKIPDTYPFNPPRVRFITKVRNSNCSLVEWGQEIRNLIGVNNVTQTVANKV